MVQIIEKGLLAKQSEQMRINSAYNLSKIMKIVGSSEGPNGAPRTEIALQEISAADFDKLFYQRQRYEVDSGRDEEPLLYQTIYSVISDPNLPRLIPVNRLGPAGVIFEEVVEGGEVKFAQLSESDYSVKLTHYATGIEYTQEIVRFNEVWNLPLIERQVGRAFNALLNEIHFAPIISATYTAANQTAASSEGTGLMEHTLRTIENAITHGENDNTNRRTGPYVLLCAPADRFRLERVLTPVFQQSFTSQSSAVNLIPTIIAYNGWSGSRGKATVTYNGVSAGKAYLISLGRQQEDFQSWVKIDFERITGNPDVSRFILEQIIFETYRGVYANPLRAVEEITLPTE